MIDFFPFDIDSSEDDEIIYIREPKKKEDEFINLTINYCPICLENIEAGLISKQIIYEILNKAIDSNYINTNCDLKKLKCNHIFHKKCIDKWFKKHKKCPICRNGGN